MKNLATLRNRYNGIQQARHQWALAIIENLKEIGKEVKVLGDYYDPEDGWPEGLHIVITDDDNYPQDIVIDSVKYEEKEHSNIAVHLCYWDPNKCDQWWSISDFSSDDADTILLAIQWPESIKQGEAEQEQDAKDSIMAIIFPCNQYKRDMLFKLSDVEKYYLWLNRDEVSGYSLDEFSCDWNDDFVNTETWIYFVNASACEKALETGAEVKLFEVWADSESDYEIEDDEQVIFNNLDEAHNAASAWAHEYDSEHGRAIFHIDDIMTGETIDTVESTPGE